jgi:hypothetical protein
MDAVLECAECGGHFSPGGGAISSKVDTDPDLLIEEQAAPVRQTVHQNTFEAPEQPASIEHVEREPIEYAQQSSPTLPLPWKTMLGCTAFAIGVVALALMPTLLFWSLAFPVGALGLVVAVIGLSAPAGRGSGSGAALAIVGLILNFLAVAISGSDLLEARRGWNGARQSIQNISDIPVGTPKAGSSERLPKKR